MIFMSQSGITDPARERDWDAWYVEHLRIMLTVPGISSAQRFKSASAGYPPSLAMYSIVSASVFQDPYYLSVRGMGEWRPLIDERYYRRNLFEGLQAAPDVPGGSLLIITDRETPEAAPGGVSFTWLRAAGLDRSTPYRGIAVLESGRAERLAAGRYGVYRPATARGVQR